MTKELICKIVKIDKYNPTAGYAFDGEKVFKISTMENLLKHEGSVVQLVGKHGKENETFEVDEIQPARDGKLEAKWEVHSQIKLAPVKGTCVEAPSLKQLAKQFDDCAALFMRTVLDLKPIKIRHDKDADGITSAIILKKALVQFASEKNTPLFLKTKPSNGAVYSLADHHEDLGDVTDETVLAFLDHGANGESENAVAAVQKTTDCTITMVDHHPPSKKLTCNVFVSPFALAECHDPYNYNTGMLAFEIAMRISPTLKDELFEYAAISMHADKSAYKPAEGADGAKVFDYLEGVLLETASLEYYEKIMRDKSKVRDIIEMEKIKMESALEKAFKKTKITQLPKFCFIQCNMESAVVKNDYPPRGKLVNQLHVQIAAEQNRPTITVAWTPDSLSFRATHSAADLGFSA
ncbi:MAG: DHH family phosphoesterase, partial [Candidatus Woesearchaeota archaeon]|nr:DHH family phosphoesterase [Candidatus Woesearchaeota archaeon]